MTREPDRFDAQARELVHRVDGMAYGHSDDERAAVVAAALRQAESSALERAAQECLLDSTTFHTGFYFATSTRALVPPADENAAEESAQECPQCAGTGCAPNHLSDTCGACGGTGMRSTDDSDDELPAPAAETGKAQREEARIERDAEWLRALTRWQGHPRCGATMEQMFYDARHPEDSYPSERCDGCDPIRLLLTRALRAAPPKGEGK